MAQNQNEFGQNEAVSLLGLNKYNTDAQSESSRYASSVGAQANNLRGEQQAFNQQLSQGNFANQMRKDQIAEQLMMRGNNLNEMNALISGQQVSSPQFANMAQGGAPQAAPLYQAGVDQGTLIKVTISLCGAD